MCHGRLKGTYVGIESDSEKVRTITECEVCSDLADRAFESGPTDLNEIALKFLAHVIQKHTEEVLAVLAEKYIPVFMAKRAMR